MKILISDFDLSLYNQEEDFNKVIQTIQDFRKRGNLFIIATGRNITNLLKVIGPYEVFYDYLICGDGTKIFDQNLSELYSEYITHKNRRDIINTLNSSDVINRVYIDDGYYMYDDNYDMDGTVILATFLENKRKETNDLLNEIVEKYPDVSGYISCKWVNIINCNTNKSTAIHKLIELKNWNKKDIYTFGDEINDYFMIKDFNGYMQKNGNPILEQVAKGKLNNITEFIQLLEKK